MHNKGNDSNFVDTMTWISQSCMIWENKLLSVNIAEWGLFWTCNILKERMNLFLYILHNLAYFLQSECNFLPHSAVNASFLLLCYSSQKLHLSQLLNQQGTSWLLHPSEPIASESEEQEGSEYITPVTVWIQPFKNATMKLGMITVSWFVAHL